jgi:hypothetical protein
MKAPTICFFILILIEFTTSYSFKLPLPTLKFKTSSPACDNTLTQIDKNTLRWNHPFKSPWSAPKTTIWKSPIVTAKVNHLLQQKVPGLQNHTFSQVFCVNI